MMLARSSVRGTARAGDRRRGLRRLELVQQLVEPGARSWSSTTCSPAGAMPCRPGRVRRGLRDGPGARRAAGRPAGSSSTGRPEHHRLDGEPARRFRHEHRRDPQRTPGRPRVRVERVVYTSSASVYGNPRSCRSTRTTTSSRSPPMRSASSRASTTAWRSTSATACPSPRCATRTSTAPGSVPRTPTAAWSPSSSTAASRASHSRSTATAPDTRLHIRRRRRQGHAAGRGAPPRGARCSTWARARDLVNDLAGRSRRLGPRRRARHVDRRDVDNIRRRVVNIEKIRRMLRWTPQMTLERGIAKTVDWFASRA